MGAMVCYHGNTTWPMVIRMPPVVVMATCDLDKDPNGGDPSPNDHWVFTIRACW